MVVGPRAVVIAKDLAVSLAIGVTIAPCSHLALLVLILLAVIGVPMMGHAMLKGHLTDALLAQVASQIRAACAKNPNGKATRRHQFSLGYFL